MAVEINLFCGGVAWLIRWKKKIGPVAQSAGAFCQQCCHWVTDGAEEQISPSVSAIIEAQMATLGFSFERQELGCAGIPSVTAIVIETGGISSEFPVHRWIDVGGKQPSLW